MDTNYQNNIGKVNVFSFIIDKDQFDKYLLMHFSRTEITAPQGNISIYVESTRYSSANKLKFTS